MVCRLPIGKRKYGTIRNNRCAEELRLVRPRIAGRGNLQGICTRGALVGTGDRDYTGDEKSVGRRTRPPTSGLSIESPVNSYAIFKAVRENLLQSMCRSLHGVFHRRCSPLCRSVPDDGRMPREVPCPRCDQPHPGAK